MECSSGGPSSTPNSWLSRNITELTSGNVFHWCLLRNNSWEPGEAVATLSRIRRGGSQRPMVAAGPGGELPKDGPPRRGGVDVEQSAARDPEAIAIRVQTALDRQDQDRAERLLSLGPSDHPELARLRGRLALSKARRPIGASSFPDRICSRTPRTTKRSSACLQRLAITGDEEAARPLRESARNLERLNTLIQQAAAPQARRDPVLLRGSGRPARHCTATPRPVPGTSWPSPAIRSTPSRSKPCSGCAIQVDPAACPIHPAAALTVPQKVADHAATTPPRRWREIGTRGFSLDVDGGLHALPAVLCLDGAFALAGMGYSREFRPRIRRNDARCAGGPGGGAAVRTRRLAPPDRLFRHVRRAGVVVRRQHLLHASGRLHPLGPLAERALWVRLPVRDRLSLGRAGRRRDRAAGRGGSGLPVGPVTFPWASSSFSGGCKGWPSSPGSDNRAFELFWYDTDWLAATLALVGVLARLGGPAPARPRQRR